MSFSRQPQYCCSALALVLATIILLSAPIVRAQIIYVSDNRSVSGSLGIDTNAAFLSLGGLASVTYSGDVSGSVSPSSPYVDFNSALNGTVNVSSAYLGVTNSYTANVYAQQISSLGSQGISYSSTVQQGANFPIGDNPYTQCIESSYFQVSFVVATATPYDLILNRGNDTYFGPGTWTLTSANLGTLVGPDISHNTGPFNYTGMFTPGDVYTLTLQQSAGVAQSPGELETLQATLEVPEPKWSFLLGMGMLCLVVVRRRRESGRLLTVPALSRDT
jgi:hypothetical protein